VGSYIVRRLGQAVVVMLGVSVLVFALIHVVPGDPIRTALGTRFDQAMYERLRARAGFDEPLVEQYGDWVVDAATGNLGVSFRSGEEVAGIVAERIAPTLSLALGAVAVALLISLPLGTLSAVRQGTKLDHAASVFSQVGVSIPDFWWGIMLILAFSLTLGWLPPSGYVPFAISPVEWLKHLVLPSLAIGVISGSILTRFVRAAMLEALQRDSTRTARSKGLPERLVVFRHVLRNAAVPIVTVGGLQLAYLLGGLVVIEIVFAWPGLGRLAFDAVQRRDYPVLQGAVLLVALIFVLVNLVVDLLYARLDPRIRYGR
jgi:peptide/nickel transport system permease protein